MATSTRFTGPRILCALADSAARIPDPLLAFLCGAVIGTVLCLYV